MTTTAGFGPWEEKEGEFRHVGTNQCETTLFFMLVAALFAGQHMQETAKVLLKEQVEQAKALLTFHGTTVSGSAQKIEG